MAVSEKDILNNLNLGAEKDAFAKSPESPLAKLTQAFVEASIAEMKRALEDQDRNGSGALSASIDPTNISVSGNRIKISIVAEDYAKFVDEGVNGVGFGNSINRGAPVVTGSPNSFKNLFASRSFAEQIQQWIPVRNIQLPPEFDSFEDLSYAIATAVKKRGIKASHFIDSAFSEESINAFEKAVGEVIEQSIFVQFELK